MGQFELPGRRMEHAIFRMSPKETANELWGQGFCARVLGVQQRVRPEKMTLEYSLWEVVLATLPKLLPEILHS